jgi:hypothetical protein
MATIDNMSLEVIPDLVQDRVILRVSCDVDFADFEVTASERLGVRYRVRGRVVLQDLWRSVPIAALDDQELPHSLESHIGPTEHVVFSTIRERRDLHQLFTPDKLFAEVSLQNEETREEIVARTQLVAVDLSM